MKRSFHSLIAGASLLALTGCGTLTGIAGGPLMGGTSMTSRLYQSETPELVMFLGTPFAFVGGTAIGIFPATVKGVQNDFYLQYRSADFLDILDPFDAGLFQEE